MGHEPEGMWGIYMDFMGQVLSFLGEHFWENDGKFDDSLWDA